MIQYYVGYVVKKGDGDTSFGGAVIHWPSVTRENFSAFQEELRKLLREPGAMVLSFSPLAQD